MAAALCFFFGPLGLIYTLTASLGLLLIWPACMLLSYQRARKHNAGE